MTLHTYLYSLNYSIVKDAWSYLVFEVISYENDANKQENTKNATEEELNNTKFQRNYELKKNERD